MLKIKRCLIFAAVMFSAALFGVYGTDNVASAKQGGTNDEDKNNSTVSLQSETPGLVDNGHININGTIVIGGDAKIAGELLVNGQTPVFEEDDPQVGANAQDMVPRWDGSALVAGSITDDGAGNVSIQNGQLDLSLTTDGFIVPRLTTAERNALAAVNGMIIYNTDEDKLEVREAGKWVALGVPGPGPRPGPFACGVDQVEDADHNLYNTVLIGSQCWMAENLNVGDMIDRAIDQDDNNVTEKYCFDNDLDFCANTGALYQWGEMMQYDTVAGIQGICPDGFHLPSDTDWKTLEMTLGMDPAVVDDTGFRGTDQGTQLKQGGTSGFQALLAGIRLRGGSFVNRGTDTIFWSSTESGPNAWNRNLDSSEARVDRDTGGKAFGFSVRCVKD